MGIKNYHTGATSHQLLAVVTPALFRASSSRYSIPHIHAALYEPQSRVHIRIARLRHLRAWYRCTLSRRQVRGMTVTVTSILVQHKIANKRGVLFNPLPLANRSIPSVCAQGIPREPPLYFVHIPPFCHEEEDGPCDDPEESEVEDPADPAGAPVVYERGRVDVDGFLVDAEGDVGIATVVRGADYVF